MAYLNGSELDGFNPLKAIGRALGSTGRVIAGAAANVFVPGSGAIVTGALNAGAQMPSPAKPPAQTPQPAPSVNTSSNANSSTLVQANGAQNQQAFFDTITALINKQAQPQIQPTPQPVIIQQPSYAPPQATLPPASVSASPPWLVPAMIGGAGLLAVLALSKR